MFRRFRLRHEQKKELRAENSPVSENDFETLKTEILQNVATAFAEPELYPGNVKIKIQECTWQIFF